MFLMATHYGTAPADAGFGSLDAVASLFTVRGLLLAGWIHYLAFDLFVGSWEVSDSRANGIHHLFVVPCLFATFMAGPPGLRCISLVKFAHRAVVGRNASSRHEHAIDSAAYVRVLPFDRCVVSAPSIVVAHRVRRLPA